MSFFGGQSNCNDKSLFCGGSQNPERERERERERVVAGSKLFFCKFGKIFVAPYF